MTAPTPTPHAEVEEKSRFADYAQEATGFGVTEWRTFRDLLVRPRAVLDAYLQKGPTGGGYYTRPMGFYIALCGLLMVFLFMTGGLKYILEQQPPDRLATWVAASGKSREAFIDDADGWMSLVAVPIMSVFYALLAAPLIKYWSGLDWRRAVRATFALLCAWTVPIVLLGPLPRIEGFEFPAALVMYAASVIAFLRMGRGLWWIGWPGGLAKAIFLTAVLMIAALVGMIPVFQIGLLGGMYGS